MSDDIVIRLRNHIRGDYEKTAEYLLGLAADEIERLREKVDKWRNLADSLARFGNCESPDCPNCDRDWKLTYQNYEQEVRGE